MSHWKLVQINIYDNLQTQKTAKEKCDKVLTIPDWITKTSKTEITGVNEVLGRKQRGFYVNQLNYCKLYNASLSIRLNLSFKLKTYKLQQKKLPVSNQFSYCPTFVWNSRRTAGHISGRNHYPANQESSIKMEEKSKQSFIT